MQPEEFSINMAFLTEFCNGDTQKMAKYVRTFLETSPAEVNALLSAAATDNQDQVKMLAHRLKPQATFVGAVSMGALLENIEQAVKQGNAGDMLSLISRLKDESEYAINNLLQQLPVS